MSTPVPVILVGCGAVSRQFYLPTLRTLTRHGAIRVVALVDPSAEARSALAGEFPQAQSRDSLAAVEAQPDTLAIIATPPKLHARQTLESFARGWHVLCEKPMASTSAECETMIKAAAEAQRLLAVGHYKRFFPASQQIRALCAGGGPLGPIREISIHEGGPFRWPAASASFFRKEQTPGGVLLDIGVHVLDLVVWWLGEPTDFTYADDSMGGLETNARVQLTFTGDVRVTLNLSRDWSTRQRYDFRFEQGWAKWTVNDANGLTLGHNTLPFGLKAGLIEGEAQPAATNAQSFIAQLQNVAAAIQAKSEPFVPGPQGIRAVELIEACYARKTLLTQPWLEPDEAAYAAVCAAPSTSSPLRHA